MTTATATVVQRSGPSILEALRRYAPAECAQFETELREALTRAGEDLDVARVEDVVARWHTRATVVANAPSPQEQEQLRRARAGDLAGLRTRDEHGRWTTL